MSQFFKYLIVALICLALGAITGILLYTHLSPVALLQKGLHTAEQAGDLAKKSPDALQGGGDKKEDKPGGPDDKKAPASTEESVAKEEGSKDKGNQKGGDNKKEGAQGEKKEGDAAKEDESTEYLRSLWPIKKRKSPNISGETKGKLYLEGTNPYGPPPTYREDLFSETKTLTLVGDPPVIIPPPLQDLPTPVSLPKKDPSLPNSLYQVEIGQFSSLEKAEEARDIVRSKGEKVDIYCTESIVNPDWFYVRLSSLFSKPQAYQKAQTIAILEKITPTIVSAAENLKKIS